MMAAYHPQRTGVHHKGVIQLERLNGSLANIGQRQNSGTVRTPGKVLGPIFLTWIKKLYRVFIGARNSDLSRLSLVSVAGDAGQGKVLARGRAAPGRRNNVVDLMADA